MPGCAGVLMAKVLTTESLGLTGVCVDPSAKLGAEKICAPLCEAAIDIVCEPTHSNLPLFAKVTVSLKGMEGARMPLGAGVCLTKRAASLSGGGAHGSPNGVITQPAGTEVKLELKNATAQSRYFVAEPRPGLVENLAGSHPYRRGRTVRILGPLRRCGRDVCKVRSGAIDRAGDHAECLDVETPNRWQAVHRSRSPGPFGSDAPTAVRLEIETDV